MSKLNNWVANVIGALAVTGVTMCILWSAFVVLLSFSNSNGFMLDVFVSGVLQLCVFVFLAYAMLNPSRGLLIASVIVGILLFIAFLVDIIRVVVRDGEFRPSYLLGHWIILSVALLILCYQIIRLRTGITEEGRCE